MKREAQNKQRTRAKLERLLALDSNSKEESNSPSESSQSASEDINSSYNPLTSTRTFLSEPEMKEANAALAAPLRKKLERIQSKIVRQKDKLSHQRDQDSPATSNYKNLKTSWLSWNNITRSTTSLVRSCLS